MQVLFGMALRQTSGFIESLLLLIGLNWTAPDFSKQPGRFLNRPARGPQDPFRASRR